MGSKKVYLAADIGAGSGRVIAGIFEDGKISLEEVNRFDNQSIDLGGGLYWQAIRIFSSIKEGIALAVDRYGNSIRSIGIDTWGVDYGFLDSRKRLLGIPYCYRDGRVDGMVEKADEIVSREDRYASTGIQSWPFNTLYQLLAEKQDDGGWLNQANDLLFIPDLINFWLSGVVRNEVTIASTGELLDAKTGKWSKDLLSAYDIPNSVFAELVEPGEVLGPLTEGIRKDVGETELKVVSVPSHDTAAAVAACPIESENALYISSGTWSLMGFESEVPFLSEKARLNGLTNERGVEGSIRLLKNIGGFWIFQQCKLDWDSQGLDLSYADLTDLAENAEAFKLFIDPDDPRFLPPGNMLSRIGEYLEETGQEVNLDPGAVGRALFEGLVLSYRKTIGGIQEVTGRKFDTIHIIGGGSQNNIINQFAADATDCRVVAGPIEASSLGNVFAQLKADGEIETIRSGRALIKDSFELNVFEPKGSAAWVEAEARIGKLLKKG